MNLTSPGPQGDLQPLLEARAVSRIFDLGGGWPESLLGRPARRLHAVQDVSLQVRPGEVLALVGESGCGKTTLARMLLGLLAPTAGAVLLQGRPIADYARRERARRVQPVFQDPYGSLNPRKTVGAIVSLPLRVQGSASRAETRQRTEQMLERVGLPARLMHSYPVHLSGGQRQRVAIARALITRPPVVICDEPTSALDVSVQAQILNLLLDLRSELGLTYVLISHNLAVVEHLATRVAVMYLGRIVEDAPAEQLFRSPRHPYTRTLLASVLTPEPGLGLPETGLEDVLPDPLHPPAGCAFYPRCPDALPLCRTLAPRMTLAGNARVECHLYS